MADSEAGQCLTIQKQSYKRNHILNFFAPPQAQWGLCLLKRFHKYNTLS